MISNFNLRIPSAAEEVRRSARLARLITGGC